jgi:hypothetical protein
MPLTGSGTAGGPGACAASFPWLVLSLIGRRSPSWHAGQGQARSTACGWPGGRLALRARLRAGRSRSPHLSERGPGVGGAHGVAGSSAVSLALPGHHGHKGKGACRTWSRAGGSPTGQSRRGVGRGARPAEVGGVIPTTSADRQLIAAAAQLGHGSPVVEHRPNGRMRVHCSCGYSSTTRINMAQIVETSLHHLRKVVSADRVNGRVPPTTMVPAGLGSSS